MNKAFKFRIYPNDEQVKLIHKHLGHNRFIWNKMLEDKIRYYEETKETLYNRPAQYKDEFSWLKEVDSLSLANTQLKLEKTFRSFFNHKAGYPVFKTKKHDYGYTTNVVNNNIRLEGKAIILPKLESVKIKQHRQIPDDYKLKHVTISKSCTNKYYVAMNYEYQAEIKQVDIKDTIGLDFDIEDMFVDSNGVHHKTPIRLLLDYKRLRRLQRSLSRREKKSSNFYKKVNDIAKLHESIKNRRDDFLHKLSSSITKNYDSVSVETLDLKEIAQTNKHYARKISQYGWYRFVTFLKYKLELQGKKLIQLDKWYPSSKTCSGCGHIHQDLRVGDKIYHCEACGLTLDRDYNAALNIKQKGLQMLKRA